MTTTERMARFESYSPPAGVLHRFPCSRCSKQFRARIIQSHCPACAVAAEKAGVSGPVGEASGC